MNTAPDLGWNSGARCKRARRPLSRGSESIDIKKSARPIKTGRAPDEEICLGRERALLGRPAQLGANPARRLYECAKSSAGLRRLGRSERRPLPKRGTRPHRRSLRPPSCRCRAVAIPSTSPERRPSDPAYQLDSSAGAFPNAKSSRTTDRSDEVSGRYSKTRRGFSQGDHANRPQERLLLKAERSGGLFRILPVILLAPDFGASE